MNGIRRFSALLLALLLVLVFVAQSTVFVSAEEYVDGVYIDLAGRGTKENPFLIENMDDLRLLRDLVNAGAPFEGKHFYQTANIDMEGEPWMPIGTANSQFAGVYDGGGHYVENLYVPYRESAPNSNGFFGYLSGTVANFGVESGEIYGDYSGSIASVAQGDRAAILNCYSKANVYGFRTAGIVDQGNNAVIAACWYDGELSGATAALVTSAGKTKIYHCYTKDDLIAATGDIYSPTSTRVGEALYTDHLATVMSLSAALAQYLFANERGAELLQWSYSPESGLSYSEDKLYLNIFGFINDYLLTVGVLLILLVYGILFARAGKEKVWERYHGDIKAVAVISGVVAVFINTAFLNKGVAYLTMPNGLFSVLINGVFLLSSGFVVRNCQFPKLFWKDLIPITVVTMIILVLELLQFDIVPRYDAHLYYGSLQESIELFRIDFLTYIGGFVFWKWAHGLALLICPFEFLMQGEMIGVYLGNMVITGVTMGCLYWLLRQMSPKISPTVAALCSATLMLFPYELGMFTYLCMDSHTALFLVWLLCSYKKKNYILTAFCGYLLAFNKISGLVFYCFFLFTMGMIELFTTPQEKFWKKILAWWDWKKIILWLTPAVIFGLSTFVADDLTIQVFYGSYTEATIGLKESLGLANTFMQGFVYGLRWLILLLLIVAVVVAVVRRRRFTNVYTVEAWQIFAASAVGCLSVLVILCLYRGDAECPRYTALFNIFYVLALPVIVCCLARKKSAQKLLAGVLAAIMLVQVYWTIDPVLIFTSESMDSGKKQIYKLSLPGDTRPGMNLGGSYALSVECLGDLYAYNLEFTYYDDVLDQALAYIDPDTDTQFVTLDIWPYEHHLYGNQYRIYWNTRLKHRTYDADDSDTIFLINQRNITTEGLRTGSAIPGLAAQFYMLVPYRIDATEAIDILAQWGFALTEELSFENMHGKLLVYQFTLQ